MGYYFSVWGIVALCIILVSIIAGWIFVTPERIMQLSAKIPEFSITVEEWILTQTGLPEDPYIPVDDQDFMIFVSKTLTEIPADKERKGGIYILKDHVSILQSESVWEKEQKINYADVPELKNAHLDKAILSQKIVSELSTIKRVASMLITMIVFIISIMAAIWYCAWSFFWGLFVWLFSRRQKNPFTYEQAVGFVLSVFFPVLLVSFALMMVWVWFPFFMTVLFLLMLWYNHLSFYKATHQTK